MSIQAPPNLSPGVLPQIVKSGINDWGGVSPLTPDYVNPEAPWPHLEELSRATESAGKYLHERLTVYPEYIRSAQTWIAEELKAEILDKVDADGFTESGFLVSWRHERSPDKISWIELQIHHRDRLD